MGSKLRKLSSICKEKIASAASPLKCNAWSSMQTGRKTQAPENFTIFRGSISLQGVHQSSPFLCGESHIQWISRNWEPIKGNFLIKGKLSRKPFFCFIKMFTNWECCLLISFNWEFPVFLLSDQMVFSEHKVFHLKGKKRKVG